MGELFAAGIVAAIGTLVAALLVGFTVPRLVERWLYRERIELSVDWQGEVSIRRLSR